MKAPNFCTEPGWLGHFTRDRAPEAQFDNGTRIVKAKSETGDATAIGMKGTILGSMYVPTKGVAYFVEWDDKPKTAVFVVGWKVAKIII